LKKVLIVDDTKNIRNLLTTCLELKGYKVFTANNGLEGLELMEREPFDIAFIDIKMPEMSGTEVLRRARSMGLTFPIIMMTAYATVKNAVECTKLGAVTYLQKPFSVEKVNDVLDMLENAYVNEDDVGELIRKSQELTNKGQWPEALKYLKKALSIDSACGQVYYLIGRIYEKNNEFEEAKKYYQIAGIFRYNN
jgi:two-component system, OmpR family, response regulator